MKLNKDQVNKAIKHCVDGEGCRGCPYEELDSCVEIEYLLRRIKELTEENERLMREKTALECIVSTARNQAKTDTVRKMQERLKAQKITHKNFGELVYVEDIDQIAKEMLEGNDEKNG